MIYMVAGYLIIWLASFAFIISLVQRQRQLRREIEALREMAGEDKVTAARETPEYKPSPTLR
jgi:CcmD family protein